MCLIVMLIHEKLTNWKWLRLSFNTYISVSQCVRSNHWSLWYSIQKMSYPHAYYVNNAKSAMYINLWSIDRENKKVKMPAKYPILGYIFIPCITAIKVSCFPKVRKVQNVLQNGDDEIPNNFFENKAEKLNIV